MIRKAYIDPTSVVHDSASIGEGAMIWNWTKVRENAEIGTGTSIGQCVYIDMGVRIGARCKIQNGVSIYQGVTLGDDVFVGPDATFTNDRVPRAHSTDWEIVVTIVEQGVSIGANATIICGNSLGRHCIVAAGSTVTADVPPFALAMGTPARVVDYVTVSGRRLRRDPQAGPPTIEEVMDKKLPGDAQK
ncbi:MAG: N-acetyltransferase [Lysobacterales bacterium]|nr:MAG: N-acetyltransferase [Xanthomonadales bacterium]